jgi:D-serine deaminase-like pyridoxal phosphate-dependent protein
MSYPEPHRAVLDAGLKAFSVDSGMPSVWKRPDLKLTKASDEHGVLEVSDPSRIALGDRLTLIPGHCDPTVNLYDALVCIRNNRVEAIWPISARGALL